MADFSIERLHGFRPRNRKRTRKTFPVVSASVPASPRIPKPHELLDGIWRQAFDAPRWNVPTKEFR